MAGGTRRKARKGQGATTAPRAKPSAPASPGKKPRAVLGNDPFTRGAAARVPVAAEASVAPPSADPAEHGGAERPDVEARAATAAPTPSAAPTPTPTSTPPPSPRPSPPRRGAEGDGGRDVRAEAAARLEDVERRLDSAFEGIEARLQNLADRSGLAHAREDLREALARLVPALRARASAAADLVRLLEPPERLDRFGMDPRLDERAQAIVELLYSTWWRVEARAIERVPAHGPSLVVANHAGVIPWDALVLRHALRRDHPAHRDLRPLLDDRECDLPIAGGIAVRLGAVRASPEAADRLLRDGTLVGVFPEGSAGARKSWRERYVIQRFGRGGFVKVALRSGAPIVPCAIVGSEEASPGISRSGWLADLLGLPLLSANPLMRFGPAAVLPLPSKWSLRFGEPVPVAQLGPAAADDPSVVMELTERVRASIQAMLDEDLAARRSVFL